MELLAYTETGALQITTLGRFLTQNQSPNLTGYVGLEKNDPGAVEMAVRLRNDGPLDTPNGISYVKEGDAPSPMDDAELSRMFTLGLAGRAQKLSPLVAGTLSKSTGHLLDVAGGTGFYTYEWLLANPQAAREAFIAAS